MGADAGAGAGAAREAREAQIGFGIALTALAGFVDALGFIRLGGLFPSFMSGNTTQLGVGLGHGQPHLAAVSAAVIGSFALGAVLGGAVTVLAEARWRRASALAVETAAIAAAYLSAGLAGAVDVASLFLALGMGVQNAVLADVKGFRAGATFVTGTLFSAGQKVALALLGRGPRFGWLGDGAVWLAFAAGAAAGGLAYLRFGFHAFAVPLCVAAASTLAAAAPVLRRRPAGPG